MFARKPNNKSLDGQSPTVATKIAKFHLMEAIRLYGFDDGMVSVDVVQVRSRRKIMHAIRLKDHWRNIKGYTGFVITVGAQQAALISEYCYQATSGNTQSDYESMITGFVNEIFMEFAYAMLDFTELRLDWCAPLAVPRWQQVFQGSRKAFAYGFTDYCQGAQEAETFWDDYLNHYGSEIARINKDPQAI